MDLIDLDDGEPELQFLPLSPMPSHGSVQSGFTIEKKLQDDIVNYSITITLPLAFSQFL